MNEEFLAGLGIDEEICGRIIAEYDREKIESSIKTVLEKAGTVDEKAARTLLDTDGINLENLEERVTSLKKEHPTLFRQSVPRFVSAAQPTESIKRGDFEKMTYRERLELFKKNPEIYKKLVQ